MVPDNGVSTSGLSPESETVYDAFVSYASADAALARSVVANLERTGLTCWIAPRDVQPGTPYAESIIRAINGAKVLVVVLSKNAVASTHVGKEIERASAKSRPIIALRIDAAPLTPALEYFLSESQWIEVADGGLEAVSDPLSRAVRSLGGAKRDASPAFAPGAQTEKSPGSRSAPPGRLKISLIALAALVVVAAGFVLIQRTRTSESSVPLAPAAPPAPAVPSPVSAPGFSPPKHSIAVLPFLNMSGDASQEYFSDGLTEELLNSLTTIPDLHVAARTSSWFFKGKEVDLSEVAHKLNVGAVLEGSVRKDGNQVRITAQLIDAVSGFHIWSQTYDRNLKDVLKLQTEIATAVTRALQATLMADAAAAIELGGTNNPQALEAYLRGKALYQGKIDAQIAKTNIADYDEAIRLDPKFAKAYAAKARSELGYAEYYAPIEEARTHFDRARAAAERAIELAPGLGLAHSALAGLLENGFYDFKGALAQHERALVLAPNDSAVLIPAAWFYADIGRSDQAVAMVRRGIELDQLNSMVYRVGSIVFDQAHQFTEVVAATDRALALNPLDTRQWAVRGLAQLRLGDVDAGRQSCEKADADWERQLCLAIAYHRLQRQSDAEAQLADMRAGLGDASAYQYSEIMAQWGNPSKALEWLETAYRLRDPGLVSMKMDALMDPLRKEPRFQEILRKLDIPD